MRWRPANLAHIGLPLAAALHCVITGALAAVLGPDEIIHMAWGFGACLLIWGTVRTVNRTVLVAGERDVEVRHGPLSWRRPRSVPRDMIAELYCTDPTVAHHAHRGCCLVAALSDGTSMVLVDDLDDRGEAFFLENELRDVLGLAPPPRYSETRTRRSPSSVGA